MSERSHGSKSLPSKYSAANYPTCARSDFIRNYSEWFLHFVLFVGILPFMIMSFFNALMINMITSSVFLGPILFSLMKRRKWFQNLKNLNI